MKKIKLQELKSLFENAFFKGEKEDLADIYFFTAGVFLNDPSYLKSTFLNEYEPKIPVDMLKYINNDTALKLAYALKSNKFCNKVKLKFLFEKSLNLKGCQLFINGKNFNLLEEIKFPSGIKTYISFNCGKKYFVVKKLSIGENQSTLHVPLII
ncbi:MAG: hypothetical protein K2X39_05605 [Silvanigrellaceae bacterium]|nr:hypothetical protein [Silvanigrellaceae bacterium]